MDFVTLDEIKTHLRLDDIVSEDAYLGVIGDAAEGLALSQINRTAEEVPEMSDKNQAQFKTLILQICASMYAQREADSSAQLHVAPVTEALAFSLRKLSVG